MPNIDTKQAVNHLIKMIESASNADETLKLTQAILNLVQAQSIASNIKS